MSDRKVIALDYDGTANTNIPFWTMFAQTAKVQGYDVYIVTMRSSEEAMDIEPCLADAVKAVVCTNRKAKLEFCREAGITVDIWIDDFPAAVFLDANHAYANVTGDYASSLILLPDYGQSIKEKLESK
jgi:hypothetical protein